MIHGAPLYEHEIQTINPSRYFPFFASIQFFHSTSRHFGGEYTEPYLYLRWFRDETLIADSRDPEIQPPPRYTFNANGSLVVADVRVADTAEYQCEVMTPNLVLEKQLHAIEVQCKCLRAKRTHGHSPD